MSIFISGVKEKYPEALLTGRSEIEGSVVGCFFKDMLLLDDVKLEPEHFITSDGRFYFGMMRKLRSQGYSSLDEVTIMANLPEQAVAEYEERGGWESIQHQVD